VQQGRMEWPKGQAVEKVRTQYFSVMSRIRVCPKCLGHNSECYHCGGGGADTPSPEEERALRPRGARQRSKKTAEDIEIERRRAKAKKDPKVIAEGQARLRRLEKQRLAGEREERLRAGRAAAQERAAKRRAIVRTWPWWKRLLQWFFRGE